MSPQGLTDNNTWVDANVAASKTKIDDQAGTIIVAIEDNDFYLRSIEFTHNNAEIHQTSFVFAYNGNEKVYDGESAQNPALASAARVRVALSASDQDESDNLYKNYKINVVDENKAVVKFTNTSPNHAVSVMNEILSKDGNVDQKIEPSASMTAEKLSHIYHVINSIKNDNQQPALEL